jgi:hypothetical protein
MATMGIDPQAAWLLLLDALASGHWRVVRNQAQDLLDWIHLGEAAPNTTVKSLSTAASWPGLSLGGTYGVAREKPSTGEDDHDQPAPLEL